ncbi:MAG: hypothetical protein QM776_16325 [Rhodocyclaceae bacterium]
MEAIIMLADILCMLALCLSLVRLSRGKTKDLGVFKYKLEEGEQQPEDSSRKGSERA